MESKLKLKKTPTRWEFCSEANLEDFIWLNLEALLGYHPLKRQHYVNEQYCDILATGQNRNLVILELKNSEDRYVIQQLTRYYDALSSEKPFQNEIDYDQEVTLIAIAPSFHRDNYIDQKYNRLNIQLISFDIKSSVNEVQPLSFRLIPL